MFFPENGASERKTPPLMKTRAPRARPSDGRFRVLDRMVFEKIGKTEELNGTGSRAEALAALEMSGACLRDKVLYASYDMDMQSHTL